MVLTKRLVRQIGNMAIALVASILLVIGVDSYLNFLPPAVQTKLPLHLDAPVVLDIKIDECFKRSDCSVNETLWYQHPKELYLGSAWFSKGYVATRRVPESELAINTQVVLDVALAHSSRVVPAAIVDELRHLEIEFDSLQFNQVQELAQEHGWVLREPSFGLWVKYGKYKVGQTVSAVKVLFGDDAACPLPGWELVEGQILINTKAAPRLAIRRGPARTVERPTLKIDPQTQKFKIMQVADLHFVAGDGVCDHAVGFKPTEDEPTCKADVRAIKFVNEIIDREKPDMLIYTGDQIFGVGVKDSETALLKALAPAVEHKIPFAVIFGNHDREGDMSNQELMNIIEKLPYNMASAGPDDVAGVGNYVLTADLNKHNALTMYFVDGHSMAEEPYHGYDWIKKSQLDFLKTKYHELKPEQDQYSHIPLSMAFFHIPLPEYKDTNPVIGEYREKVMSPEYNSGTLEVLKELGVSVATTGHDHCNDFCKLDTSELKPIWLCYGGGGGEGGYGGYPKKGEDFQRRIRIFEVDTQDSSIYSWKWLRDATEITDKQMLVQNGQALN